MLVDCLPNDPAIEYGGKKDENLKSRFQKITYYIYTLYYILYMILYKQMDYTTKVDCFQW